MRQSTAAEGIDAGIQARDAMAAEKAARRQAYVNAEKVHTALAENVLNMVTQIRGIEGFAGGFSMVLDEDTVGALVSGLRQENYIGVRFRADNGGSFDDLRIVPKNPEGGEYRFLIRLNGQHEELGLSEEQIMGHDGEGVDLHSVVDVIAHIAARQHAALTHNSDGVQSVGDQIQQIADQIKVGLPGGDPGASGVPRAGRGDLWKRVFR